MLENLYKKRNKLRSLPGMLNRFGQQGIFACNDLLYALSPMQRKKTMKQTVRHKKTFPKRHAFEL